LKKSRFDLASESLKKLGLIGEMKAQEFLADVPRPRGDYVDFYPIAALVHAGYICSDSVTESHGQTITGKIGVNTHETAVMLCQLALPAGQSFEIDGSPRESWHGFPMRLFMTAEGYLRLDELEKRRKERNRKRIDYFVSFVAAVIVALLSSSLANYYASKRAQAERAQQQQFKKSP
jgi:hypothetical protein